MPLDINNLNRFPNAQFQQFVDFAETAAAAGKQKAVARFDAGELGGIVNRTIKAGSGDWVGIGVGRLASLKRANNITRDAFRKAVADMFGGENHIPASVKDAMKLDDYGKGKPLTARRILAVKAAIDAVKLETFQSADTERIALNMGFVKSEFPKLARAAHFYAQAAGLSEPDALKAVAEPNSKPNRLMQYGGRFLDSAENFANGLRLMDSFKDWFTAVRETKNAGDKTFANARTFTDLNIYSQMAIHDSTAAFERFVFEELAVNGAHDLSGTDPEKLFGMKDNAAMRFFGANRQAHFTGVLASVPPEKRGAIFAVFDKLSMPLPETKEDAARFYEMPLAQRGVRDSSLVIGRILRHLPEIESLMAKGKLTEANIVKTLCPDMSPGNWTIAGLNYFTHNVEDIAKAKMIAGGMDEEKAESHCEGGRITSVMEETCCTLDEAIEAVTTGKRVAPPKYMTNATYDTYKLDGTTKAARNQLDGGGSGDFFRAYDYGAADDPKNEEKFIIKDKNALAFGFTFPDGTSLKANAGVHKGNIPTILDKLESLAGRVHPRQQSALLYAVSQAGICTLKGGLEAYGIASSEHAAVNFTLSRDDATGAITVKYESPEKLPIHFSWTATIDVDGNMTSTPLKVMDQAALAACKASADEAAANLQKPDAPKGAQFQKNMEGARALLDRMMRATDGDRDLINLLKDATMCSALLFDSLDKLRPASVVQARVEAFKENVAELREATKGNPLMFKMGLERIKAFGGKPVPKGMLTAVVKAVNAEKIDKLKKLSASTARTPDGLHGAVAQYHAVLSHVIKNSGIMNMFDGDVGGEEMLSAEMLVGGLLAGRCGEPALRAMKGALSSPVTGQLQSVYNDLDLKNFLKDADLPPMSHAEVNILSRIGGELRHNLSSMLYDVYAALGDEQVEIPPFEGNLADLDGLPEIFDDVRNMTQTLHADLLERERRDLGE